MSSSTAASASVELPLGRGDVLVGLREGVLGGGQLRSPVGYDVQRDRLAPRPRDSGATGVACTSSDSGTATTPATSSSETPVEVNAVTSRPVRTAWAATGSSMAALRIALDLVDAPGRSAARRASRASAFAEEASAVVSCRRWRVSARSSSPSSASAAARS